MADLSSLSEIEIIENYAENGETNYQIKIASQVLTSESQPTSIIKAYKWLFLANILGNAKASDLIAFLRLSMSDLQVNEADRLVEEWLETKTNEFLEDNNEDWSEELRNLFKNTTKKQMLI